VLRTFGNLQIEFPLWLVIAGGFVMAFILTYIVIPSIVKVSGIKGLYDEPNFRTSHLGKVPTLGGAGVFIGFILTISIFTGPGVDHEIKYIIGSLLILFFIGIKDDILIIDPKKKLIAQIIAASIISILGDIRISNLHNIFGINEIPYIFSILLTILVVVYIINGFNLIDGIDGLASGVGLLASVFFGTWFLLSHFTSYSIMSFALAGSLFAFFLFNVFGKKNKIFLGDTGSLIIGLIISVFAIRFAEYDLQVTNNLHIKSSPSVVFGVLIVPLFDTLRIIVIRILQGKSPFQADRQHVHHRLLALGNSHLRATMIILGINLFFIVFCLLMQSVGSVWLFLACMILACVLSFIPVYLINKKQGKTGLSLFL
jgi:UDP-N-acetylmuramyl pentapeptide phosphotransferase/UDP-N-acetylglucosamine-1-phosphate transferase